VYDPSDPVVTVMVNEAMRSYEYALHVNRINQSLGGPTVHQGLTFGKAPARTVYQTGS
jgi:hypothetical protein